MTTSPNQRKTQMNTQTTIKYAPQQVERVELGKADRVFEAAKGHVFKLAQHIESGQWAIWLMTTETHDQEKMWAETKHLSIEETIAVMDNYKLPKPIKTALLVDDDISPEYARSNEGIFEMRCLNIVEEFS
jgi:predicted carbohydrate-binding protein with CBM5 and CBM33 domain